MDEDICNHLASYLLERCNDLIRVLRFFVEIGATSIIDKLAHASSIDELRNILSEDVARALESVRRSARVEEDKVLYIEEVRDEREEAYYRSLGVLKEEGGKKVVKVVIPRDPDANEVKVVEEVASACGVRDVASTLALLARTYLGHRG